MTAAAAGAIRYMWTKNGAIVTGGTDGDLAVEWVRGCATDTYTVTPVYDVYGVETEGEPVTCEVTNLPNAFVLVIR